jgi:hypothetical protein
MSYARQMLDTYSADVSIDPDLLAATIDALKDCAQACGADIDANLSEPNLADMVKCIRLCLDCVDVCTAAVGVVSRRNHDGANVANLLLTACVASCQACGDECHRHAHMHAHCRVCEEACRRCEESCRELLDALK